MEGLQSMEQTDKEKIESLQKALFYESQYRSAIISGAISYYDANLTKDLIETDVYYRDENGKLNSSLKLVGLTAPCKFSEFINRWIERFIDKDYAEKNEIFSDSRQFLIDSYHNNQRDHTIEYWYTNDKGKELFLSQRFLLTQNEEGDICTLAALSNTTHAKRIPEPQG